MVRRCLASAVIASSLTIATAVSAQSPAVIELFTSQGCSSCPQADRLLGELAPDPAYIAITLPIDVWDYLGWRDTLADPAHTQRWQGYSKARGDRERYTPQVVVNGAAHALGSDRDAIDKAIAGSRRDKGVMSVPVKIMRTADGLSIALPDGAPPADAMVTVWGLAKAISVMITRGENKGRTVTYHNVVRRTVHVGVWSATSNHWDVRLRDLAADGVEIAAATVQHGTVEKPGAMLGAAMALIR